MLLLVILASIVQGLIKIAHLFTVKRDKFLSITNGYTHADKNELR